MEIVRTRFHPPSRKSSAGSATSNPRTRSRSTIPSIRTYVPPEAFASSNPRSRRIRSRSPSRPGRTWLSMRSGNRGAKALRLDRWSLEDRGLRRISANQPSDERALHRRAHAGFSHCAIDQAHPLARNRRSILMVRSLRATGGEESVAHGIECRRRPPQHHQQIFLSYGPVRGVNQIPPTPDRFLHLGFVLFSYDQGINQPVDLALDRLIRD